MANSRIDAVVTTIKAQREASRLCSEMARDTADSAESAAAFASDGEERFGQHRGGSLGRSAGGA